MWTNWFRPYLLVNISAALWPIWQPKQAEQKGTQVSSDLVSIVVGSLEDSVTFAMVQSASRRKSGTKIKVHHSATTVIANGIAVTSARASYGAGRLVGP